MSSNESIQANDRLTASTTTHEVTNQPDQLGGHGGAYNAYDSDHALRDAVRREGGAWGEDRLSRFGEIAGDALYDIGAQANEHPPRLRAFDRFGHRIEEVEFHPAWHDSMRLAKAHGIHSLSWTEERPGAQVVRSALAYLHNQFEAGSMCPITMTHAAVPALRRQPDIAEAWLPGILADQYDPRSLPASQKSGLTVGMGMTEKQGGSDVRANTTVAKPVEEPGPGRSYTLVGHKWFFSAPMCDAFLVLAQAPKGLSCFLLPKWRPDGTLNAIEIQRLKDKLGDKSNASSEVEFREAFGWMIGPEGRGVPTILDMVAQTRLDCVLGSAGLMRQSLVQAIHHCSQREAFGGRLIDKPLMRNVLADLALESEAAIALAMRLARAFESGQRGDADEARLARLAMPIAKYWVCKRAPATVNEAQECLGGAGYVEESILPRLYRQAPLNSIWEGSGNVQCLDMLRAISREPECLDTLRRELHLARGRHEACDRHLAALEPLFAQRGDLENQARRLTQHLALALQASILLTADNSAVAEAFCNSRLGDAPPAAFGTLPASTDFDSLISRARVPARQETSA